jgi:hypothetical protein
MVAEDLPKPIAFLCASSVISVSVVDLRYLFSTTESQSSLRMHREVKGNKDSDRPFIKE